MGWLTYVVLLCLCVQALLLPAQRAAERAHFHLAAAGAPTMALGHEASGQVDRLEHSESRGDSEHHEENHGRDGRDRRQHLHDHGHAHSQLAVHDHEHGDADDVVYADVRDAEPTTGQAPGLKRILLDLDGPWMARAPNLSDQPSRLAFVESTSSYRTQIVLPLERPPRARG